MNNIYNVLYISNSITYAEEFKRIAQFNSTINLLGIARGLHDFVVRYQNYQNVHVIIVSDDLADGTLSDVIGFLSNLDVIVFGVIKNPDSKELMDFYQISSMYEKDIAPADLVDFLASNLQQFPIDEESHPHQRVEEEEVEQFVSRFSDSQVNRPYQDTQQFQTNPYPKQQEPDNRFQQGYREVLTSSQSQAENSYFPQNSYDTSYQQPPRRGPTTMGVLKPKVVCMTSAKGGVGKSALAIEIASCIAARGREVEVNMSTMRGANNEVKAVLVDLNCAFGTIASTLPCVSDMKNPPTLADWVIKVRDKILKGLSYEDKRELQSQENPRYAPYIYKMNRNALSFTKDEVMSLLVKDAKSGLFVLPTVSSNYDIAKIENEFIEIIVEELHNFFDVVMLDTGNNFEGFTQTAFRLSDEIYVVAQPNVQVCVILMNLLKDSVEGLGIDKTKFKLIINHPQTNKQVINDDAMQKTLDIPLAGGISHDENMLLAHDEGKFYVINNKKKAVSKDITLIANQICPLWNVTNAQKKGGLIQKLFGK